MSSERKYILRPEDEGQDWRVARLAFRDACQMVRHGKRAVEVIVQIYRRPKTDPQNKTIWMWHGEVASQLTERCREAGSGVIWRKDDVHELIFKPRFMPQRERMLPDGELVFGPMGTSDKGATVEVISEAMEKYLSWIYSQGMEVTIPDDPEIERIVGRAA